MRESAQLQREAEAQRAGLSNTLGQLREGMTSSALSAELVGVLRDSSLTLVKSLADSARSNPGAALLIGAGLTMMLTKTTGADVMSTAGSALKAATAAGTDAAVAAASGVKSAAGSAADTARSLAGQASDKVTGMTDKVAGAVSETAGELRDKAGEQVDQARRLVHDGQDAAQHLEQDATRLAADTKQAMSRLLEEQPILVAAIGTALGAIFGAALPASRAERNVLGRMGAEAIDKGRDVLETAKEKVSEQLADAHLGEKVDDMAGKMVDTMVPTSLSRPA